MLTERRKKQPTYARDISLTSLPSARISLSRSRGLKSRSTPVVGSSYLVAVKTNWLLRDVTTVTVYELPATKTNEVPESAQPLQSELISMLVATTELGAILGPDQLVSEYVSPEASLT